MTSNFKSEVIVENDFGYCVYEISESRRACIYNLYVYKKYRRSGVATQLLKTTVRRIRSQGYKGPIIIEAVPKEESISELNLISFYEKLGLWVLK